MGLHDFCHKVLLEKCGIKRLSDCCRASSIDHKPFSSRFHPKFSGLTCPNNSSSGLFISSSCSAVWRNSNLEIGPELRRIVVCLQVNIKRSKLSFSRRESFLGTLVLPSLDEKEFSSSSFWRRSVKLNARGRAKPLFFNALDDCDS